MIIQLLEKEHIFQIIIELRGLFNRIDGLGYRIELTDAVKDFVAEKVMIRTSALDP